MAIVLTAENKSPDNSPSLTTSVGLIWIFSLGWLLSYLQQLTQSYALNLAVFCLVANELWRCFVITAAVSLFLSPPFYYLLIYLKSLTETPSVWFGFTLSPSLSLVIISLSWFICMAHQLSQICIVFWSMLPNAHLFFSPSYWLSANGLLIKLQPKTWCIFLK